MEAHMMGKEIEVRFLNEDPTKWYKVEGEPFWDWVAHEWRIAEESKTNDIRVGDKAIEIDADWLFTKQQIRKV